MAPTALPPAEDGLDLGELLARLVGLIDDSALGCTALQWSISALLDKVHHPDLGEEIHMLQDIDRLQQTLADIAAVIGVAATMPERVVLARDPVGAAIRLENVRARLGLIPAEAADTDSPGATGVPIDDRDVTWL